MHRAFHPSTTMGKGMGHVGEIERRLVVNMHKEGVPFMKILKIIGRSHTTLTKILYSGKAGRTKQKGAPRKIAPSDFRKILRSLRRLDGVTGTKGRKGGVPDLSLSPDWSLDSHIKIV